MTDTDDIILHVEASAPDQDVLRRLEDALMALALAHGATVQLRAAASGWPEPDADAMPTEVHLLRFPGQAALDAYLRDPRRAELRAGTTVRTRVMRLHPIT